MKLLKPFVLIISIVFYSLNINAVEPGSQYDLSDIDSTNMPEVKIDDPLENLNRGIFQLNKGIDKILLKPVATMYNDLTPDWCQDRAINFFQNLQEPVNIANAIFKGDMTAAANNFGRFLANTILGLGGIFDVAHDANPELKPMSLDFGMTLKSYGASTGPYLMLPILGPSSFRDAPSLIVDYAVQPFNHYAKKRLIVAKTAANILITREQLLDSLQKIEETSIDEYATIRSIYFQKRN